MISDLTFILIACAVFLGIGMLVVWLPMRRDRRRIENETWRAARRFYTRNNH